MAWIDLFKTGTHTDSSGDSREWSELDLQTIVQKYNNQKADERHKAPAIAGEHHTDESLAAYGWVKSLKIEGGHLYGEFEDVEPEFEKMVNQGRFGTVSIALYPDLLLRHVAFLGAKPPAIKGLKTPKFSEDKKTIRLTYKKQIVKFNERAKMNLTEFMDAVGKDISESDGTEVASNVRAVMEKYKGELTSLDNKPVDPPSEQGTPKFSEPTAEQKRITALELELQQQKDDKFFSEVIRHGKLLPKQKQYVQIMLDASRKATDKFKFSENKTMTGEEAVQQFINSLAPQIEFGGYATGDKVPKDSQADLDKFIENRQKKGSK